MYNVIEFMKGSRGVELLSILYSIWDFVIWDARDETSYYE